eukprot:TRINITY_DN9685_c0_g1_i1.p1 TRINITY_DN9685_c0_g1~~TRINITY_DN9685_c0_g1_i1.p1  ORF type:complete len:623 (-),score=111.95 TRINITY_DN9685_c0_g1_i1:93-1961(-)
MALAPAEAPEAAASASSQDCPASPLREVALSVLHRRSSPLTLSSANLARGLDSARRLDALEWLVQAYDALGLPDRQLFAAFGLLDRFAAASPAPISAGPGAFALVLASMLVALKVSGTKKDLDRAKRLVVEVSGNSRPWNTVRRAEVLILRRLSFRVCTPTAHDMLDRLMSDFVMSSPSCWAWGEDSKQRCANLAQFLLELCIVHDPEAAFGAGRPSIGAALAALLLSLLALDAPKQYAESLAEPIRMAELSKTALIEVAGTMRERWISEEQRTATGNASAVAGKWQRRITSFGVSPPLPAELRQLIPNGLLGSSLARAEAQAKPHAPIAAKGSASPTGAGRSARRVSVGQGTAELLATLPTPARRSMAGAPGGGRASQQPGAASEQDPTPRASRKEPAAPLPEQQLNREPSPVAEDLQEAPPVLQGQHFVAQHSQAAAQESLSLWPVTSGSSSAAGAAAASEVQPSSPEPLLELTHVLNMVAPKPQPGAPASSAANTKPRPSTVASELLVSSALRMQWPVDKRKVPASEAAQTCREAAAVLQEAIAQLSATATALETGGAGLREMLRGRGPAEWKRRRTFGGPSPLPGANSPPPAAAPRLTGTLPRGSPTLAPGRGAGGLR